MLCFAVLLQTLQILKLCKLLENFVKHRNKNSERNRICETTHSRLSGRLTDAGNERVKTLARIEDYENKRLASLKEAVASIDTSIHNLKIMV